MRQLYLLPRDVGIDHLRLSAGTSTSPSLSVFLRKFHLVHTRWLLHHLPQPERVIERMIAALRPRGCLLLKDVDFFPVQTSTSALYVDFILALTSTVVAASGRDCLEARALPALVAERGLADVGW